LVNKALDPDPYPDPYWPPSGSTGSGSGSVKNEYGSETLVLDPGCGIRKKSILGLGSQGQKGTGSWIRNTAKNAQIIEKAQNFQSASPLESIMLFKKLLIFVKQGVRKCAMFM
jgi:hypothetical protein